MLYTNKRKGEKGHDIHDPDEPENKRLHNRVWANSRICPCQNFKVKQKEIETLDVLKLAKGTLVSQLMSFMYNLRFNLCFQL